MIIARGNAPGNERSEYEAHDACGLKNEPALRRKVYRGSIVVANDRQLTPSAQTRGRRVFYLFI
jgi:hypothetical protein